MATQAPCGAMGLSPLAVLLALKALQAYGYYSLCIVLALFLSTELGFSDTAAGAAYGVMGMAVSAASLVSGWLVDRVGTRRSLLLGAAVVTVGRACLAATGSPAVAWWLLTTVIPVGEALGIPVLAKAVGAVSSDDDARFNFGLFYTALNVAVLCVGPSIDAVRRSPWLAEATGLPPYRILVWASASAGAVSFLLASVGLAAGVDSGGGGGRGGGRVVEGRRDVAGGSSGADGTAGGAGSGGGGVWRASSAGGVEADADANNGDLDSQESPNPTDSECTGLGDAADARRGRAEPSTEPKDAPLWTPRFKRFITVVGALVGVRCLFRHLDATFPKYAVRAFGEDAPYGLLYAINPALIIALVPVMSSLRSAGGSRSGGGENGVGGVGAAAVPSSGQRAKGGSGAPMPRAKGESPAKAAPAAGGDGGIAQCVADLAVRHLPGVSRLASMTPLETIYCGAALSTLSALWLVAFTSLGAAALFVATLSVGEALWSPTFYWWTHSVAPPSQSGRYFALANVPLFLPKLLAGMMSGALLESCCPAPPAACERPRLLWLAVFAASAPFVLLLRSQWRWLARVGDDG